MFQIMPNALSPNTRVLQRFSDLRNVSKERHADIAGADGDGDDVHPVIRDIRDRIVDYVKEMDKRGFLDEEQKK